MAGQKQAVILVRSVKIFPRNGEPYMATIEQEAELISRKGRMCTIRYRDWTTCAVLVGTFSVRQLISLQTSF